MADEFSQMDRWTETQVAHFKKEALSKSLQALKSPDDKPKRLVAEGDSWFDYGLAGTDLVDCLRDRGYHIKNFAARGDATRATNATSLRT